MGSSSFCECHSLSLNDTWNEAYFCDAVTPVIPTPVAPIPVTPANPNLFAPATPMGTIFEYQGWAWQVTDNAIGFCRVRSWSGIDSASTPDGEDFGIDVGAAQNPWSQDYICD